MSAIQYNIDTSLLFRDITLGKQRKPPPKNNGCHGHITVFDYEVQQDLLCVPEC